MLEIAFTILSFMATLAIITVLLERRDLVNAVITFSLGALLFGIPIFISMSITYTLLIMTMGGMLIAYATNTVINRVKARAYAPLTEAQRRIRAAREARRSDGPVIDSLRAGMGALTVAARGAGMLGRAVGLFPARETPPTARPGSPHGRAHGDKYWDREGESARPARTRLGSAGTGSGDGSSIALARTLLRRDDANRRRQVETVTAAVQAVPPSHRYKEPPLNLPEPDPAEMMLPGRRRPPAEAPSSEGRPPARGAGDRTETVLKRFSRRPGNGGGVDGETIQTFSDLSRKASEQGRTRPHLSRLAARRR